MNCRPSAFAQHLFTQLGNGDTRGQRKGLFQLRKGFSKPGDDIRIVHPVSCDRREGPAGDIIKIKDIGQDAQLAALVEPHWGRNVPVGHSAKNLSQPVDAVESGGGVTFTGIYELVEALAAELNSMQRDLGLDNPIHIDADSGGFIAPFIQKDIFWDFKLDRVRSINASGHKYGLAPLGVGWVFWAAQEDLNEELIFYVDYLGGNMPTFALNFSRPGGEIIAQYYNFLRLGMDGYTAVRQACSDTAQWLAEKTGGNGIFRDGL
jgi:hypothetical protein